MKRPSVKRPTQTFDIVEVVWDDASAHTPSWEKTVKIEPTLVISVGFLVLCNKDYVVIAQDWDGDEQNGRTQIPAGMVKTMKVLKKKDKCARAIA